MNFLNRRMFQGGGPSTPIGPLGPNQIYDTVSGKIYNLDKDFVSDLFLKGRNLYPILKDDTLIKGSNVASALEKFRDQDEPFDLSKRSFGYLQPRDVGTGLIDAGIATGKFFEPYVKKGIAGIGEFVGSDYLKTADDDVGVGLLGFKRDEMDSIFPTDQERSRAALERITGERNFSTANMNPNVRSGTNMFFDALRSGDEKMSDYFGTDRIFEDRPEQQIQDFQSEIDGFVGPIRPGADVVDTAIVTEGPEFTPRFESETLSLEGGPFDMETRRLAYQEKMIGRDEFGNLLPEGRLEQDDEISRMLEDIKPAEQKVDVDKTEADTLADNEAKFGGLSQDEFRATIDDAATPKLLEIERPITDTTIVEEETLRKQNDPVSRKLDQPGFFGSDRFLNFIRNVGGELVRTGQFGEGLASGAAKASEERAARELMADKEERDYRMKLRLAKAEADLEAKNKLAEGMKPSDIKTFTEFEDDIAGSLSQFDESERIVSDINQILNEDIKDPGAFGARGFITQISDKFRNLAGYGEEDWNKLAPAVRTQVILDVTAQRSVRQILGESGKTISNLDRDIVARIFGKVGVFTSPAELSKLLTNSRDNIVESMRKDQSLIISRANAIGLGGYNSPALMANESLINRILGFSFDNIQNYKLSDGAAGYIEATL
jgi:hypothetical protein